MPGSCRDHHYQAGYQDSLQTYVTHRHASLLSGHQGTAPRRASIRAGTACVRPSLGSFPEECDSWSMCISQNKVCQASLCSTNRLRWKDPGSASSHTTASQLRAEPGPAGWGAPLPAPLLQSKVGEARLPLISPDLPSVVPSVNFFNGTPLRTKQ